MTKTQFQTEQEVYEHYLPGYLGEDNDEIRNELWWGSSLETRNDLLTELQYFRGKGDDYISMGELSYEMDTFSDWPDLLSYDVVHWEWQSYMENHSWDEKASQLNDKLKQPMVIDKVPDTYVCQYDKAEINFFHQGTLYLGLVSSAVNYVMSKATKQVSQWASTQRNKQREINLSWLNRIDEYKVFLTKELNSLGRMSFVFEVNSNQELPVVAIVFANNETIKNVRPAHFLSDLNSMPIQSNDVLEQLVELVLIKHKIVDLMSIKYGDSICDFIDTE
jgi:hypothetical protein